MEDANVDTSAAREALVLGQPPRILPLPGDEVIGAAMDLTMRLRKAALGSDAAPITVEQLPEIMTTLACHPELWQAFANLSMQLLGKGALARRDTELVALRTTWLCGAPYAWGEHVVQGKSAGLSGNEIERIKLGSSAPAWDEHDRAMLQAVEQLHEDAMISDAVWAVLAQRLDDRQLFELPVLVGQFTSVAYFQNALRLSLPHGNSGLRAR